MNKITRPTAYLVQDVVLDRDLGLFRSREEAEAAAREYGEAAVVLGVSDDPEVGAAWEKYRADLAAAVARAEEAARAALAGRHLPEGWRVVIRPGGMVRAERRRWVYDVPGWDVYAHGEETESVGSLEWVPADGGDQMPQAVREAAEAASAAASAVPRPTAPELIYAPELSASARPATTPAWAEAALGYWLLADVARLRRLWRQMREAVEAAREAEKRADPMIGAIFGAPELGEEARQVAELARREGRERAEAARRAVLAELERHDQARVAERQAARERERAQRQAARERERAERERAIAERRAALPPVGAVVQAEQTYRLRKQAPCIVGVRAGDKYFYANVTNWTGDEAQTGTWTGQVRVISHRAGRAYGRQYDLEVSVL